MADNGTHACMLQVQHQQCQLPRKASLIVSAQQAFPRDYISRGSV